MILEKFVKAYGVDLRLELNKRSRTDLLDLNDSVSTTRVKFSIVSNYVPFPVNIFTKDAKVLNLEGERDIAETTPLALMTCLKSIVNEWLEFIDGREYMIGNATDVLVNLDLQPNSLDFLADNLEQYSNLGHA